MTELSSRQSKIINAGFASPKKCFKWSILPVEDILRRKLFRKESKSLESIAELSWEIAPSETSISRPAYFLPNQLERVTGWANITEHPRRQMNGGIKVNHLPTRGFLLKDVWLIDGVLYKDDASNYLLPRTKRWPPQLQVENEIEHGAVYCTDVGSKFFGQWLLDDCVTYSLAAAEGIPISTAQPASPHTLQYENWLDMRPERLNSAFINEVVIFQDRGQNQHRRARFRTMGKKLLSHVDSSTHPGVFILRGNTGARRILHNELEIANYLHDKRGFRIVDITKEDVPTIMAKCAGAQVVAGVEGSQLIHGILVLPPGGSILTLQPPNRFCDSFKPSADQDQQNFGFVVGIPEKDGFHVTIDEVERTLDLFPYTAY